MDDDWGYPHDLGHLHLGVFTHGHCFQKNELKYWASERRITFSEPRGFPLMSDKLIWVFPKMGIPQWLDDL